MSLKLKSYVVTATKKAESPLFVSVNLNPSMSFQEAKAFVLAFNQVSQSGKTVIRPATAALNWDPSKVVPLGKSR